MNIKELEELLSQEEGISLEFKESLDLESREGKGKFLKELLALTNSSTNQAYIIVGIEDKTKKPVGYSGITEEKLQQIVARYSRPPIALEFQSFNYQGAPVAVIQAFHRYSFYTLNESYIYKSKGKDVVIREKAVFIRRGSTVDEATMDEVVDLAQSELLDTKVVASHLNKITGWLKEIAYNGSQPNYEINQTTEINRSLETTFVALLAGLITARLWQPDVLWIPFLIFMGAFFFAVVGSAVRLLHFGLFRAILTSFVVSVIMSGFFLFGPNIYLGEQPLFSDLVLKVLFGLIAGSISGIIGHLIIWSIERKTR